ncbi:MAG: carboxypeptidase-like regulatory domain-containing protein [Planctomycetia bacterium]
MHGCLATLGLLAFGVGCGPAVHEITGMVMLDGRPVDKAEVLFVETSPAAKDFVSKTGSDGRYRIRLRPGDYRVSIVADKQVPAPPGLKGIYGDPLTTVTVGIIPRRYNEQSELRCTVSKAGVLDFDLASDTKR